MRLSRKLIHQFFKNGFLQAAWERGSLPHANGHYRGTATHGVAGPTAASGASLTRFYRKVDVRPSDEPGKVGFCFRLSILWCQGCSTRATFSET